MRETPAQLAELQRLLDDSLSRSSNHLRSIIGAGERALTAEQLTSVLTGMRTLAISTVTAGGEPRLSAGDGHFLNGRWVFGTSVTAAKARHLAARPAVSVALIEGEKLGVFTHGTAVNLNPEEGPEHPEWPDVYAYLRKYYGAFMDRDDLVFYLVEPHWMVAWAADFDSLTED
ncbi:pyridoxamine 5'-phosphate oxidase family protein [Spongiactinospora sp. TRM90649]|uniref:pyridoxamine 5'-phosphate oxidase family protein n=1 Tax=Spongiactinospora sp. TRM90649 TaxID=3031114 RepID=UPI0023F9BFBE|nr:pyridoxamine 5'-phosphate oxidase family protein [Spongiactinospora sp. TRM90649]MDF5759243.1 pyridoxamine 5'-phosphate oxidase family protein [Spongiactinospora sp. TRM90649]